MTRLLLILFLAIILAAESVHAMRNKPQRTAMVVIDNSSTTLVGDRKKATRNIHVFLQELAKLRRHKPSRNMRIQIILTTKPNSISWVGRPADLHKAAPKIMKMIEFRETCSDLELAFREMDTTVEIEKANKTNSLNRFDIYVMSPMINVPFTTCDSNPVVNLPQEVPQGLLLGKLAKQANSINLFNVNDDQKENYLDYMKRLGLKASWDIKGLVETSARLSELSEGRGLQ